MLDNMISSQYSRFLIVGVGGQGCVTIARLLGRVAAQEGMKSSTGELHGMSQRGGSVEASVAFDGQQHPMINRVGRGVLVALELTEAHRACHRLSAESVVVLNSRRITPFTRTLGGETSLPADESLKEITAAAGKVHTLDADSIARQAGAPGAANMVLIGALAALELLPFSRHVLQEEVARLGDSARAETNQAAFFLGFNLAESGKQVDIETPDTH